MGLSSSKRVQIIFLNNASNGVEYMVLLKSRGLIKAIRAH